MVEAFCLRYDDCGSHCELHIESSNPLMKAQRSTSLPVDDTARDVLDISRVRAKYRIMRLTFPLRSLGSVSGKLRSIHSMKSDKVAVKQECCLPA